MPIIDHYLSILHSIDLTTQNRATINRLLVGEEDKLGHDLEHLQFAEDKLAKSQNRMTYLSRLRDAFADGSADRAQAEKMLENFEATHQLTVQFCHRLRAKVNSHRL